MQHQLEELSLAEKQLISTLNWFRSHYALYQGLDQDRPATLSAVEQFGRDWIGRFKENWGPAFVTLSEKEIISFEGGSYQFTAYGSQVKEDLEMVFPFYQMEYDNFFDQAENSISHQKFCERVYGLNLTQHGLIDLEELEVMINSLQKLQKPKVMDLGCGNGNITQHLHKKLPGSDFTGIDISSTGISYANQNFAKPGLAFYQGNMKSPGPGESFDAFIALDTFYYVSDLKTVLSECRKISAPGARMLTYFSQWIMDESYQDYLNPEMTRLARECKELNLSYKTTDLTASGIQHWKLKEKVLKDMKDEFFKEGFMHLWDYRFREATRYANWGDDKYARFFYEIAL